MLRQLKNWKRWRIKVSKKIEQKKTFSFRLSREKIKEFKGASTKAKLNWLEEANNFINKFLSPQKRKIGDKK